MTEGIFRVARNRGAAGRLPELLALECDEQRFRLPPRDLPDRLDRARPEDPADNGRVLEERFLLRQETVEPGGDDPVNCFGQVLERAGLREHPGELLDIERVSG